MSRTLARTPCVDRWPRSAQGADSHGGGVTSGVGQMRAARPVSKGPSLLLSKGQAMGLSPSKARKVADGSATRPSSRLTYADEADMGRGGAADATERKRKQGAFRKIRAREALKQRRKVKMIAKAHKAEAAATAIRARRAAKAAHAATFAAKGVGAISIAALPVMLACALFLIVVIGLGLSRRRGDREACGRKRASARGVPRYGGPWSTKPAQQFSGMRNGRISPSR